MEHNEIRHRLSGYTDGSVSTKEKKEIEAHLQTYSVCIDGFRELQKAIESMKTVEDI